ncbi:hypothetical protein M885DRAFT_504618 [Pelagophyceae sp. CCMP2097]|nr:hypothetical protein M885DRAFT_504618 [Pelagophyceae sp. CCMP2097]|mmetsp:Transcript_18455/g.62239  ORF Transcript_18455/g.62239 Transcript_18455/m.62239 type:complete len:192 (-) Transcript_18455:105-680(-)
MGLVGSSLCQMTSDSAAAAAEEEAEEAVEETARVEVEAATAAAAVEEDDGAPAQSDAEALESFKEKFVQGLVLIKFGRNSVAKKRIFLLDREAKTFTWKVPMYRLASQKAPGQGTVYRVADITKVRRALEPDPKVPLFGGTENLRKGLPPKEAGKAFILDMADNRTIDLVATTEAEAKDFVEGFKRLIAEQ